VEDDEERTRHGAEGQEALGEVGDALLDHVGGFKGVGGHSAVPGLVVVVVGADGLGDAERLGMEWGLGDEAVGER